MIYRTANVSFPRSGHHALKTVLAEYFGPEFRYCDNYRDDPALWLKCNAETNYQKEHDLNLDYPSDFEDVKYLVQIRDPVLAIQSWIDFDARVYRNSNTDRFAWKQAFRSKMVFWNKWFDKWVLKPIPARLVVPYTRLLAMPYGTCESVVQFMTGQHADPERLRVALEKFPIVARPERYSHYVDIAL